MLDQYCWILSDGSITHVQGWMDELIFGIDLDLFGKFDLFEIEVVQLIYLKWSYFNKFFLQISCLVCLIQLEEGN